MRIGIVTLPLLSNYGGILQNYAMSHILKRLGHTPITIDCVPAYPVSRYLLSWGKTLCLWFIPWRRRPFRRVNADERNRYTQEFINRYIDVTRRVEAYSPALIQEYRLDALVAGSDQIWRREYTRCPGDMYLEFAVNSDVRKIAYAASFGTTEWLYSDEWTARCRRLAGYFDAVSVREESGVGLCEKFLGCRAQHVLDPTLLLDSSDYEALCGGVPKHKPSVVAYILDQSAAKIELARRIAEEKGLQLNIFGADDRMTLSIEEWLGMFRDAEFVLTDSFHGTVFAIIFNKQFISIGNRKRGIDRMVSLLSDLGLEDRLFAYAEYRSLRQLEWGGEINLKLSELKQKSIDFLRDNLR